MVDICSTLSQKADEYGVAAADIIQFAAGELIYNHFTGNKLTWPE